MCLRWTFIVLFTIIYIPFITCYYECNRQSVSCGCGFKKVDISTEILNGENAVPYSWSMAVSLRFNCLGNGNTSTHCCSGTILSDSHILTAAHCVDQISPTELFVGHVTIAAGIYSQSQQCQTIRIVDQIYITPGWTKRVNESKHDIAVLHLNEPLDFIKNLLISRTCIPSQSNSVDDLVNYPPSNINLVVIGWGVFRDRRNYSVHDTIKQATLLSVHHNSSTCVKSINGIETQFCAAVYNDYKSSCVSDSGSPIFQWMGDRWVQVGIASYEVNSCENINHQIVFTRVAAYSHWINTIINRSNYSTITATAATTTRRPQTIYACNRNNITCGCGYTNAALSLARIIKGEEAVPYSWSMVVSIRYDCFNNGDFKTHCCAGTILNDNYILTVAQCVTNIKSASILSWNITVAAGIHNLTEHNQIIRRVDQIFIHPGYVGSQDWFRHNIAILHLTEPLDLTTNARISRTCRSPQINIFDDVVKYPINGSKLVVVGWGLISNQPLSIKTQVMQQLSIYAIDHVYPACAQYISDVRIQFCAGFYNDTKGPCDGDFGGPVLQWLDDHWEQVGITSYVVRGCAAYGSPSVYTRLSSYHDWIEWVLNSNNHTITTTTATNHPPTVYDCNQRSGSCGCGKTNVVLETSRIIGGHQAIPYSWSMIVSIRTNCFGDGNFKAHCCAGTILNEHYILTAAHCVFGIKPNAVLSQNITIAAGIHNLSDTNATVRRVDRIFIHPNYTGESKLFQNDIAIIHLDEPLDLETNPSLTKTCRPHRLDTDGEQMKYPSNGAILVVIGWGATNKPVTIRPQLLQQLMVHAIAENDSTCARSIGHIDVQFCGGSTEGGTGICKGDSGGPIFEWFDNSWLQVGISSYMMHGCASSGYQSIFTRLASFYDWIEGIINTKDAITTTIKTSAGFSNQMNFTLPPTLHVCNRSITCGCGYNDVSLTNLQIVGREYAVDHSWSMVVSLRINTLKNHQCSGTILSKSYILTAARCVWNIRGKPNELTVAAGITNINDPVAYTRKISRIHIYPQYSDTDKNFRHDIALLRVDHPFTLQNSPILAKTCMRHIDSMFNVSQYPMKGTRLTIVGWTKMNSNHRLLSGNIQQVQIDVIDNQHPKCSSILHDSLLQFCASLHENRKDACRDDFDGPIFQWTGQYWEQVGIASNRSADCKGSGVSGIYTRLSYYYDWIQTILNIDGEYIEPYMSSNAHLSASASCNIYSESILIIEALIAISMILTHS